MRKKGFIGKKTPQDNQVVEEPYRTKKINNNYKTKFPMNAYTP